LNLTAIGLNYALTGRSGRVWRRLFSCSESNMLMMSVHLVMFVWIWQFW